MRSTRSLLVGGLLLLALFSGCSSSSESIRRSHVEVLIDSNNTGIDRTDDSSLPAPKPAGISRSDENTPTVYRSHFGLGLGSGMVSSGDLYGLSEFFLSWSFLHKEDIVVSASLAFQDIPLQKTSALNASLDGGLFLLGIAMDVRWYRTPDYTFIGHYLSGGVGLYGLFWEYRNELELPHYDSEGYFTGYELVKHDVLGALDLHGGLGLDLGQIWSVNLEGELSPGFVFGLGRTMKGFDNDVFKPFLYAKLRVSIRFASPL
jgi:hypothetical protein